MDDEPAKLQRTGLSPRARSLWAKSDYGVGERWLPLFVHLHDTMGVIGRLWDEWLPSGTRDIVCRAFAGRVSRPMELARACVIFLGAAHDVGKATPVFQAGSARPGQDAEEADLSWRPRRAGLPIDPSLMARREPTHAVAGQVILESHLTESRMWSSRAASSIASVVGAHHGRMPKGRDVRRARALETEMGWSPSTAAAWRPVQAELVEHAIQAAGLDNELEELGSCPLPVQAASVVSGLVIMADWIASNQDLFPLIDVYDAGERFGDGRGMGSEALLARLDEAWDAIGIIPSWHESPEDVALSEEGFSERFGLPATARPRPVQVEAVKAAHAMDPAGILVIEAPMGEGKTEAALAAAEVLAARSGRGGVCVALPTMATTDAMFGRVHRWIDCLPRDEGGKSVYLAHGKARLNEEFQGLVRASRNGERAVEVAPDVDSGRVPEGAQVSEWMRGRKKGLLANFVVCTVDQVLMGALQMKHLALRHLALANKVVVIDECHAYDVYMQQYLCRALEWLGAWGTPVVLLSATLPKGLRDELVRAYRTGREVMEPPGEAPEDFRAKRRPRRLARRTASASSETADCVASPQQASDVPYPVLTYTTDKDVRSCSTRCSGRAVSVSVTLSGDEDDDLVRLLGELLGQGGCAGVICSTVRRAQHAADLLRVTLGDDVILVHAAFADVDRMESESTVRAMLGPGATRANGQRPKRLVVVGTQVLEQSLDIDFDVLITDVAPVDLLLQRMGRLHRHAREEADRPEPVRVPRCYVRGVTELGGGGPIFARGITRVYASASLMESLAVLGLTGFGQDVSVSLPTDIAPFVQEAYDARLAADRVPTAWRQLHQEGVVARNKSMEEKRRRAEGCLLKSARVEVRNERDLTDLTSMSSDDPALAGVQEQRGQQAVRDTQESVEVILAHCVDGRLYLLPWVGDEKNGVPRGSEIPTSHEPDRRLALLLAQSAVRLPASMCRPEHLDGLIGALEEGCGAYVGAWQDSAELAGCLLLPLEDAEDGELAATVFGWRVSYTRQRGLAAVSL